MKEINDLLRLRKELNKKYEKAYYSKKNKNKSDDYCKALDDNSIEIISLIKENFKVLDSEYIIITLTHIGSALNIIYDDNGFFTIATNGFFPTVYGKNKLSGILEIHISENKKQWKKSIKSALKYFINKNY